MKLLAALLSLSISGCSPEETKISRKAHCIPSIYQRIAVVPGNQNGYFLIYYDKHNKEIHSYKVSYFGLEELPVVKEI